MGKAVRHGGAKSFVDRIRSISFAEVAREANRPISVAIVGDAELRMIAREALFSTGEALPTLPNALPEPAFVQEYDAMSEEAQFPRLPNAFDFVLDVSGNREGAPDGTVIYTIADLGGWEKTLDRIVEDQSRISLALARNFPVFRRRVAQRIISQTATTNAQFSLITGVAAAFPILSWIGLPAFGLSDILVLTKNQIMMTLQLAAAYGLSLDYKDRMKEIAPILLNAFGWRAVARELVGAIPGIGFVFRAMVSYAGTATIGKAVQTYYETGEKLSAAQVKRLYKETYEASREKIRALAASLRRNKTAENGGGGNRKRLPAPAVAPANLETDSDVLPVDFEPIEVGERSEAR